MTVHRETFDVWTWRDTRALNIQLECPDDTWVECNISGEPYGVPVAMFVERPRRGELYERARELQRLGFHL